MICRSLSQVGQAVFLKKPKNKKFRVVTIPASALKKLQAHRKKQQPQREHFGDSYQGDYIFCNPDGSPLKPEIILRGCFVAVPQPEASKGRQPSHLAPYARLAPARGGRALDRRQQTPRPRQPARHGDGLCSHSFLLHYHHGMRGTMRQAVRAKPIRTCRDGCRGNRLHVALHPQQRNHGRLSQQSGAHQPASLRLSQLPKLQTPSEGVMFLEIVRDPASPPLLA